MSVLSPLLLSLLLMVPRVEGFQARMPLHSSDIARTSISTSLQAEQGNQEERDLFDYFDPLLSPHAYPNGIDAGPSTTDSSSSTNSSPASKSPFGFELGSQSAGASSKSESSRQGQDLFDYFDPLLSPHAYPNGIDAGASKPLSSVPPSPLEVVKAKKKVGVLLMDHGSRNNASNVRLEKLAELYQMTANFDQVDGEDMIVVEPAHMEIASPTIAEGLKKLLDQGVDEIICHPYFLSPGRHVTEDIPQLLEEAKNELKITIPMVSTQPIGANTQLMIGAIHALVQENSSILQNQNQNQI